MEIAVGRGIKVHSRCLEYLESLFDWAFVVVLANQHQEQYLPQSDIGSSTSAKPFFLSTSLTNNIIEPLA
jgi:hypothetical protein